jgi:hypothetical protein
MAQNAAVMSEALPADVLYALFTALDPKRLLKGGPRPSKGQKSDPTAQRDFEDAVKAAAKAKSASEFAKLIGAATTKEGPGNHGAIVGLEVYPRGEAVLIIIKYADGVEYQHYYPAGTL